MGVDTARSPGTELTGYQVHSVFEDFTWDKTDLMAGASDDWAYEHLGIYSWTTEFWDVVAAATGERAPTDIWWLGPSAATEVAVARWADQYAPESRYVDWYPFEHPQLGSVELGGPNAYWLWSNPPTALVEREVAPHADFAIAQAMASPRLEVIDIRTEQLGPDTWRVLAGIANTGWLGTTVTALAAKKSLVRPIVAELTGADVVGEPRLLLGQLAGRSALRFDGGWRSDGTPDRVLAAWVVRGQAGSAVELTVSHQRGGTVRQTVTLAES